MSYKQNRARLVRHNRVRDTLVDDASASPPVSTYAITDGSGNSNNQIMLAPQGVDGVTGSNPSGTTVSWAYSIFATTHLPWLRAASVNYEEYRILNATLIVVGNVGSTATGRMAVMSSTDFADESTGTLAQIAATGVSFDVASLATRERRIPLMVDSGWKQVSKRTLGIDPASSSQLIPINNVNGVMFTSFQWAIVNGAASTIIAGFDVEYDVEFRRPVFSALNL